MESRGKNRSSSSLAPGFRFHPTDEELVRYYLRRKVCGRAFRYDAISEIDIYKAEPWDLPSKSRIQSRDQEWYFFSVLDKKYGNGSRTNRATGEGYWKTTGKDREVYHRTEVVGMKKTLVYHNGRAPKGQRTNWVMHEYRLVDAELERVGIVQDPCYATVLCRVFQKSGSGPKNGEQYGATFVEEDWEDDVLELSSKQEFAVEVDFCDDAYLDGDDLEQILASEEVPSDNAPLPVNVHSADGSNGDEITESANDTQNYLVSSDQHCESENHDYKSYYNISAPYNNDMDEVKAVKREYIGESSKSASFEDVNFLLDEPFMDVSDHLKFGDGGFVEPNGFSNVSKSDASVFGMLDEYLIDFNANDDSRQYFAYDSAVMPKNEDLVYDESLIPKKELYEGFEQATLPSGEFSNNNENNAAASQFDDQELGKYQSDFDYSFIKQASQILGSIPAPPALAAEFPSKEAMLRLSSAAQSSSHVTAGMIQIRRNMNLDGKNDYNFNILVSFGYSRGDDGSATLESSIRVLPGKLLSSISRGWLCFMFLWVLILSMNTKFGTYITAAN